MAYKTKSSPLRQSSGYLAADANKVTQNTIDQRAADVKNSSAYTQMATPVANNNNNGTWMNRAVKNSAAVNSNPNLMQPKSTVPVRKPVGQGMDLNQTGFASSQKGSKSLVLKSLYGGAMDGTQTTSNENLNGSPLMQTQDLSMQQDAAVAPPTGVQTNITPTLGFEND